MQGIRGRETAGAREVVGVIGQAGGDSLEVVYHQAVVAPDGAEGYVAERFGGERKSYRSLPLKSMGVFLTYVSPSGS